MKKGWKIALISLGSLLGLLIIVLVVVCWLLFTPSRLTAIVNKLSSEYVLCESHFSSVDLSLFKTWPDVGLKVNDVVLINPYQLPEDNALASKAVQNDTLAYLNSLTLGIDLKAFLQQRAVVVRQLRLEGVRANLYTAPDGWTNIDVFATNPDTTEIDDDTSSSFPDHIQLEKIVVKDLSAQYCDLQQQILASLNDLNINLHGTMLNSDIHGDLDVDMESLLVDMRDSVGNPSIYASLVKPSIDLDGRGTTSLLEGKLKLVVPSGEVTAGGNTFTTDAMLSSHSDLLTLNVPFVANLDNNQFLLNEASICLTDYQLDVDGAVALASNTEPMQVDLHLISDRWQVGDLLAILPSFITQSLKGMKVDGKVSLSAHAYGAVAEGRLPRVDAEVTLDKGSFSAPKMLPMPLRDINAQLAAHLNLSSDSLAKGPSDVRIDRFHAKALKSVVDITGTVNDLMDDMLIDAKIKGKLHLPDLRAFLPDTMPLALQGTSQLDLSAKSRLSDLSSLNLEKIIAKGTLNATQLDVVWDSIHAASPSLKVAVNIPKTTGRSKSKVRELIGARITGGILHVDMANNGLVASVSNPDIQVGMPNILDKKQALAAAFNICFSHMSAEMDSMLVYSDTLYLKGSVRNDSTQDNILKQWNPDVDIDLNRCVLSLTSMSEALRMPVFRFNYKPEVCNIEQADILWGVSDYHLNGKVFGLEEWLSHKEMLHGELNFSSQYADIDQLLNILSGMGSDEDTLQKQRQEDNVPKEANPFIVPKDVNVKLNTHINRCIAFGNDLNQLGGSVTVNDGVAILDQIGFTCKAARMQLTGVYKSPRVNHLFTGLDFHLLDIDIDELIDMIPSIDTLVPMLSAFKGKADFHLAAECNLDAFYKPKMSTLLGAAAISGKDLVVLDNQTVASLARLLQFKNWREKDNNIGIDSISVEATVFRKEIEVFPFLLNLHNYQLCIGGRHTLDNNCNYHLELIQCPLPVRLAVDVKGNLSKPQIQLGSVQYADLYRPEKHDNLQARTLQIKKLVRQALEANVRK